MISVTLNFIMDAELKFHVAHNDFTHCPYVKVGVNLLVNVYLILVSMASLSIYSPACCNFTMAMLFTCIT